MTFKTFQYICLVITVAMIAACTPKTSKVVSDTTTTATDMADKTMEDAKDMVSKVKEPWRAEVPKPGPARKIEMGEYNSFTMDNGLEVIVVENNKLPRISYQISLKNDPMTEGDQAGYVDIAGDLIGRGTATKSKAELDEEIDFIGASLSTFSSGMFGSSLTKHTDALLSVMTDVLYNATLPAEEFEKIKTQTLSGLETTVTDPNSIASNVAAVANYGVNHPYGEVVTKESVENIKLSSCEAYYKTYFKPNNAYLVIVGDVDLATAKKKANKYFGSWTRDRIPSKNFDMPMAPSEPKVVFANKDGAVQSIINVTYPIDLKPGSDDEIKSQLLNSILGGGVFLGRLMQNLREDKAFTYGARSRISSDKLVGNFNAFASVRNEVTDSSVTEFLYEMNRIVKDAVSEEDLQLAKNSATGAFARSLERPQNIARYALNIVKYDLPADYYDTYLQKVDAVTISDLTAMANKYIKPSNANIVVVGNKDDVADKLMKFDGDGQIDYYDAFGKPVVMDETPLADGVTGKSIVESYIAAIGGKDKVMGVHSAEMIYKMAIMGQEAEVQARVKNKEKVSVNMLMGGNVMQSQVYDGTKMSISGMGQSQIITEGDQLESMKKQGQIIEQMIYMNEGYELDVKGKETVDGANAYKVKVTDPSGKVVTEFYDVASGLLLSSIEVSGEGEQVQTITRSFTDYKEVDGIMLPHNVTLTGAAPFPMVMEASSMKLNPELDDAIFMIEE